MVAVASWARSSVVPLHTATMLPVLMLICVKRVAHTDASAICVEAMLPSSTTKTDGSGSKHEAASWLEKTSKDMRPSKAVHVLATAWPAAQPPSWLPATTSVSVVKYSDAGPPAEHWK